MWNRTVPVSNRSRVNRVDPIRNGAEHIRSRVNVALISTIVSFQLAISNIEKKGTFIILQVISCLTITAEYLGLSRHVRM